MFSSSSIVDPELKLKEEHRNCFTEWLVIRKTHIASGRYKYHVGGNHCSDRACPVCIKYRVGMVRNKLNVYFNAIQKPKHIVLTTKNMRLTEQNLAWFRNKVRSFYKVLLRSNAKFFGVTIIEIKPSNKGLYNVHVHIACNLSPRHDEVTKVWSRIVGYHCSTQVRYRVKRKAVLNYFARRVALSGLGLPVKDYLSFVKGTRLFSKFGVWSSYLEVLRISETDKRREFAIFVVCRVPKAQAETIPPPELFDNDYLESLWQEMC